ncbi:response regulator transcription factor [Paraflavisolibacter sp. H34]|uniref:response regulator transcription factor n=1 Tax=Huijunlia imazamoxiresistens TaxID=3127457 RepID=UPI003019787E
MKKITIIIVDDHTLVREAWAFILDRDARFSVVGECGTGEEALELVRLLRPEIVLMDINLPAMSGLEAAELIQKEIPASKVIGISFHAEPAYARRMIQKGALGYLTKNSSHEEMYQALLEVHQGRKYICQEIKDLLAEQMVGGGNGPDGLSSLTPRELEIAEYIQKGHSSREIAETLQLSTKTVEVHRHNLLKKLKLKNTAALVAYLGSKPPF